MYRIKGQIYEIQDSAIILSKKYLTRKLLKDPQKLDLIAIQIPTIKRIEVRINENRNVGIILGTFTGIIAGGIISASSEETTLGMLGMGGFEGIGNIVVGGCVGGCVGGLIGSMRLKIPIDGNLAKFKKEEEKFRKYLIKQ